MPSQKNFFYPAHNPSKHFCHPTPKLFLPPHSKFFSTYLPKFLPLHSQNVFVTHPKSISNPTQNIFYYLTQIFCHSMPKSVLTHAKVFSHPTLENKNYHSTPKFFLPFTQNNMSSPKCFLCLPQYFWPAHFYATPPTIFLPSHPQTFFGIPVQLIFVTPPPKNLSPLGAPKFSEFTVQSHFILGFMRVKQLSKTHNSQNLKRKNRLDRSNSKESLKIKVMASFLPYILKY